MRTFILLFIIAVGFLQAPLSWAGSTPDQDVSLEAMLGQMLLVGFRGLEAGPGSPIIQDIAAGRVGGVILFDRDMSPGEPRNISSPEQLSSLTKELQKAAAVRLFIAVDQEGGKVQRLKSKYGFPDFPAAKDLGAGSPEETRAVAGEMGRILSAAGCNLNFAPVADLNLNPENPVIGGLGRSFGPDPTLVAAHAAAFVEGLAGQGVLACLKHFPGHGSSRGDTHKGLTDVTETWSPSELEPYRMLFGQGFSGMVMTAHIVHRGLDPDYPATLSRAVVTGQLREKLGFTGVIVSDDLQMAAVAGDYPLEQRLALAVNAGVDLLLFGNNLSYEPEIASRSVALLKNMVEGGVIPLERIRESHARIMAAKEILR